MANFGHDEKDKKRKDEERCETKAVTGSSNDPSEVY